MDKKVLFCATVDYHFKAFHLPYLQWFKEQGWDVHVAASGNLNLPHVDKKYNLPIQRSPFNKENILAYKELKKLIDKNKYQIIHCHTPIGGVLGRLAARHARKKGTNVLYTAHGFHFCKGAPLQNWLIYYPIEKAMSRFTDVLITINQEDYQLANKHHFKAGTIRHIHGVGVDTERFKPIDDFQKKVLRKEYGYKDNEFLLFYAAEFNKNKNQQLLIRSLGEMKEKAPNVKLLLAGDGPLLGQCEKLAMELGVSQNINFLGFRKDVEKLLKISDAAVASSLREGLPVNIIEAMACGLPVIATENRGHRELVQKEKTGWLVENQNPIEFAERILSIMKDNDLRLKLGRNCRMSIMEKYSIDKVLGEKISVYSNYIKEKEGVLWAVH